MAQRRKSGLLFFLVVSLSVIAGVLLTQGRTSALTPPSGVARLTAVALADPASGPATAPASGPASGPATAKAGEKAGDKPGLQGGIDHLALGYSYPAAYGPGNRSQEAYDTFLNTSSCTACHSGYEKKPAHTMHAKGVTINCVDCHGGNADVGETLPRNLEESHASYQLWKSKAHVTPRIPELWKTAANPEIPGAKTLEESPDFIRFVNPGDLHAATVACASCHKDEVRTNQTNIMAHGAMLWQAALYNNGAIQRKNAIYGESYTNDGLPRMLVPDKAPTRKDFMEKGHIPALYPLPRWEITQPGNILRVFERGGKRRPNLGVPDPLEENGRPEVRLSIRGFGTDVRTDPVFIGLQKTRLLDPTLQMFGTNDHPGDYRGSGCTACHVMYANDRSPVHSGKWAKFGNRGKTVNPDPTMNKEESGHPVEHVFTKSVPSSQCIVCHIHPGTIVVNSYLGFLWWDNETDGQFMYPAKQQNPTGEMERKVSQHNPEQSAARGLWANLYPNEPSHAGKVAGEDFLENLTDLNKDMKQTQFADFHGHGWVFRAVYKQDRKGNLLDASGNIVTDVTASKLAEAVAFQSDEKNPHPKDGAPVHLKDIHLEKGMHCVDCHFSQDVHGDGNLYGETRNAVMEECIDCHGTSEEPAVILQYLKLPSAKRNGDEGKALLLRTWTGNASDNGWSVEARLKRNKAIIDDHFKLDGGKLYQVSSQDPKVRWAVVQAVDSNDPESWWSKDAATKDTSKTLGRYAHTIRRDGKTWGTVPTTDSEKMDPQMALAHSNERVSCYACHTSWTTACFGCHLPMKANQRKDMLHNEGWQTRNYTNYNFQTLRDDVYMLGVDSTVKDHKVVPIRSACAVMVTSEDAIRQTLYQQQQTVSAEGYSGTAFTPYFPHTVRATETKQCADCHLSKDNDNNAIMAQLLLHGTNSVNFVGKFLYVGVGNHGVEAVAVAEQREPQAVIGSRLHELAFPDDYKKHVEHGLELHEDYEHPGNVLDLQMRGEYLYAACGKKGFIAYDIANIGNKGFSERILTAPVSPLGQRFYVKSKYATSITSPSTMAVDPTRPRRPENEEGKITEIGKPEKVLTPDVGIHLLYAFLYLTDAEEGLIVIGNPLDSKNKPGVATMLDGDPENNFIDRAVTFNPDGALKGAKQMALYGHYAYVACDAGIQVIDLDNPLKPRLVTTLSGGLSDVRKIQFQFRYGFVVDAEGMKVIDVTFPENPTLVAGATIPLAQANDIYVSRTYGYIAAGKDGLVIVDLERPEQPQVAQVYNADGALNDTRAVKVAMTNASMFAYVADGRNGVRVLQLTSADDTKGHLGFSPKPNPRLIAVYKTLGDAIALSEGLDRDRAVDESGHQLAVFGRRGARPFTLEESQRLYLRDTGNGTKSIYQVSNTPETAAVEPVKKKEEPKKEEAPKEEPRRRPGRRP